MRMDLSNRTGQADCMPAAIRVTATRSNSYASIGASMQETQPRKLKAMSRIAEFATALRAACTMCSRLLTNLCSKSKATHFTLAEHMHCQHCQPEAIGGYNFDPCAAHKCEGEPAVALSDQQIVSEGSPEDCGRAQEI